MNKLINNTGACLKKWYVATYLTRSVLSWQNSFTPLAQLLAHLSSTSYAIWLHPRTWCLTASPPGFTVCCRKYLVNLTGCTLTLMQHWFISNPLYWSSEPKLSKYINTVKRVCKKRDFNFHLKILGVDCSACVGGFIAKLKQESWLSYYIQLFSHKTR